MTTDSSHILIKAEKPFIIPREVEQYYKELYGDILCSKCKQIIKKDSSEESSHWTIAHIQSLVAAHLCNGVKFDYDFNDPRTLKEQMEAQKKLGGHF